MGTDYKGPRSVTADPSDAVQTVEGEGELLLPAGLHAAIITNRSELIAVVMGQVNSGEIKVTKSLILGQLMVIRELMRRISALKNQHQYALQELDQLVLNTQCAIAEKLENMQDIRDAITEAAVKGRDDK